MKTPDEIRAQIEHWKSFVREQRAARQTVRNKGDLASPREKIEGANASIEAAAAAIVVSALSWALGETSEPTILVKIR